MEAERDQRRPAGRSVEVGVKVRAHCRLGDCHSCRARILHDKQSALMWLNQGPVRTKEQVGEMTIGLNALGGDVGASVYPLIPIRLTVNGMHS